MKRSLLALTLLASLAAVSLQATQFWYDPVSEYPQGGLTTNSAVGSPGGPNTLWWSKQPGSMTAHDLLVTNITYTNGAAVSGNRLRVSGLGTEYVQRWLNATNGVITNQFIGSGTLYASFIVNASSIPTPPSASGGTYFATFNDGNNTTPPDPTNGFEFRGRVYQVATTNSYPFTNTFPSSYLIGVANNSGDPAQTPPGPVAVVPVELAKNIDYQVVLKYDIGAADATVWVNPASESDNGNQAGPTSDNGTVTNALVALLLRQRTGGGTMDIRDIAVGDSFADVMTNTTPGPVWVAMQTGNITNYAGNPALLAVAASSIRSGQNLTNTWYHVGTGIVGGNSSKLLISSLSSSDEGSYYCAVTNSVGSGSVSGTSYVSVNTTATAPVITSPLPATTNGQVGGTLTLSVAAYGTGPLSYVWTFNGNSLTDLQSVTNSVGDASVVHGSTSPTLVVNSCSTFESGTYQVTVSGGYGSPVSSHVAATINNVKAVNIAYIRSLENPTTWQVTDTTTVFTISNAVVTIFTNLNSGQNTSYYIADATGGLDIYEYGDPSFRPNMGDIVNVSGTLSEYNNGIELDIVTSSNPYEFYTVAGHSSTLPAPIVFGNFATLTNNVGYMQSNIMGHICMITNVWWTNTTSFTLGTANTTRDFTNAGSASPMHVYFPCGGNLQLQNQTVAPFAYSMTGVMWQYQSGSTNTGLGREFTVTRIGDIVTTPPRQTSGSPLPSPAATLS